MKHLSYSRHLFALLLIAIISPPNQLSSQSLTSDTTITLIIDTEAIFNAPDQFYSYISIKDHYSKLEMGSTQKDFENFETEIKNGAPIKWEIIKKGTNTQSIAKVKIKKKKLFGNRLLEKRSYDDFSSHTIAAKVGYKHNVGDGQLYKLKIKITDTNKSIKFVIDPKLKIPPDGKGNDKPFGGK